MTLHQFVDTVFAFAFTGCIIVATIKIILFIFSYESFEMRKEIKQIFKQFKLKNYTYQYDGTAWRFKHKTQDIHITKKYGEVTLVVNGLVIELVADENAGFSYKISNMQSKTNVPELKN